MRNTVFFQNRTVRCALAERHPFHPGIGTSFIHALPGVPALPETLLHMDLKLHEPCVDLREMSELVLSDLGAALQILRLAGQEYGDTEDRPTRIEDCISDLGLHACIEAASAQTVTRDSRHQAIAELWSHSRRIAQCARFVAEELPGANPDEACLVGLFHAIGLLPSVLGWDWRMPAASDEALAGFTMAGAWSLPACVTDFFSEMISPEPGEWSAIVAAAHQLATRSSMNCLFEEGLRPQLHKRAPVEAPMVLSATL